jgi:hypothetical protein
MDTRASTDGTSIDPSRRARISERISREKMAEPAVGGNSGAFMMISFVMTPVRSRPGSGWSRYGERRVAEIL